MGNSSSAKMEHKHPNYSQCDHSHDMVYANLSDLAMSAGTAGVPSLLVGASATVSVTLVAAMADTSYTPVSALTAQGVGVLANLSITSTTVVSTTRVDVVVKNNGLVTLTGAIVLVIALRT